MILTGNGEAGGVGDCSPFRQVKWFRNDKCVLRMRDEKTDSLRQNLTGHGVHLSSPVLGPDQASLVDSGWGFVLLDWSPSVHSRMTNTDQKACRYLAVYSSVEETPTEGTEGDCLPFGGSVFSRTQGVQRQSLPLLLFFTILQHKMTSTSKQNIGEGEVAHSGTLHTTHKSELKMDRTYTMSMK